ncbi:hypothetical protein M0805_004298 [Coniferiporia weirii]|nr:hypothetical protein M0805_004298 [Coniferiporia weirii]
MAPLGPDVVDQSTFPPLLVSGPPEDSEIAQRNFTARERASRSWLARLIQRGAADVAPLERRNGPLSSSLNSSFDGINRPDTANNGGQADPSNVLDNLSTGPTPLSQDSGGISLKDADGESSTKHEHMYRWAMMYENQRGFSLFSAPRYSSQSLLPKDPPPFSLAAPASPSVIDEKSTDGSCQPTVSWEDYPLPDGNWRWASKEWMVDMRDGGVQFDGFEYNWVFRKNGWRSNGGHFNAGAWVRRRRWVRLMERPPLSCLKQDGEPEGSTDNAEAFSVELDAVWRGDEEDWPRLHRAMQTLSRDGHKLEVWKEWSGTGHLKSDFIAAVLREHADDVLCSFVYPISRVRFLELVVKAGLLSETELLDPEKKSPFHLDRLEAAKTLQQNEADHPLHIAARTYALSLSLSLGPALIPAFASGGLSAKKYNRFVSILQKELGASGFAFAMTTAVGGGGAMEYYWQRLAKAYSDQASDAAPLRGKNSMRNAELNPIHRTLLCHVLTSFIAITLMQTRQRSSQTLKASIPFTVPISPERSLDGRASGTLDLTLLLLVRALDSLVQGAFQRIVKEQVDHTVSKGECPEDPGKSVREVRRKAAIMTDKLDAIVFWLASARIMWCFVYRQERLPRSYVKWIGTLANVDNRLLEALRRRRRGTWTYGERTSHKLLESLAEELGYPSSWGNTLELPPTGECANEVWERLGVKGRAGVGGLPCEIVHGGVGGYIIPSGVGASCCANIFVRCSTGFLEALAIYAPVHFLPILFLKPSKLLSFLELRKTIFALTRSSLFLSVFITSMWSAQFVVEEWYTRLKINGTVYFCIILSINTDGFTAPSRDASGAKPLDCDICTKGYQRKSSE